MATISFFHWISICGPIEISEFVLIPIDKKNLAEISEENKVVVASIFDSFNFHKTKKMEKFTLIKFKDKDICESLTNEEIEKIFIFSQIVAVAQIVERKYFNQFDFYCCSDSFHPIVQNFKPDDPSICITSYRKDGNTKSIFPLAYYQVIKPVHVKTLEDFVISNTSMIKKILNLQGTKDWESIYDSIQFFLRANSGDPINSFNEILNSCGSIERLLKVQNGNKQELAPAFLKMLNIIKEDEEISFPQKILNSLKYKHKTSARELWINDFFSLRGNIAHGRIVPKIPLIWSVNEHELISSEVYVILLCLKLSTFEDYELTNSDLLRIYAFDHRLRYENLFAYEERNLNRSFGWNIAFKNAENIWHEKEHLVRNDNI